MTDKRKGQLSILLMSIFFFMGLDTRYTDALGDYVLEFLGLKSWSAGDQGLHLTLVYFGILFMISLFFVKRICIEKLNYKRRKVFAIFAIFMFLFASSTDMIAKTIKKTSDGLLAIGYNSEDSEMSYSIKDGEYIEFESNFQLMNYSEKDKEFYLAIDNYHSDLLKDKLIRFYTYDGDEAKFYLKAGQEKEFNLDLEDYEIKGGSDVLDGGGYSSGFRILLEDDDGNTILLEEDNFFGIKLNK